MRKITLLFISLLVFTVSAAEIRPKYLFLLIGDGMGPNVVKLYRGQMEKTAFDRLGTPASTGTNNAFGTTTDSAASGTALACGVKTYNGAMAMDKDKKPVTSLAKLLQRRGMKIGIISSVAINDATPGTHYANRVKRRDSAGSLSDMFVSGFDFFGVSSFAMPAELPNGDLYFMLKRNKFAAYKDKPLSAMKKGDKNVFVSPTRARTQNGLGAPAITLADVTAKAIELLDNPNGFFMMVEGGAIDGENHCNDVAGMMHEMIEFDKVVNTVLDFAEKHPQETLVVVTADHDTGGLQIDGNVPKDFWKKQTVAHGAIDKELKDMFKAKASKDELIAHTCKRVGITTLSADEKELINKGANRFMEGLQTEKGSMYGKYNPLVIAAYKVRDKQNNYHYTTFTHTPTKVLTFAFGNGSKLFVEPIENSDIPRRISIAAVGTDLLKENGNAMPFPNVPEKKHFTIQTVSENSITARYNLPANESLTLTLTGGKEPVTKEISAGFARVTFDKLNADTEYVLEVAEKGKESGKYKLRTLPEMKNILLTGAVIADPHTSTTPDNPRQRFHSRSGQMLEDAISFLNEKKVNVVLVPGDVTDRSRPGEIELFEKIAKKSKCPVIYVPGNHDYLTKTNPKQFNRAFKTPASYNEINGIQIVSLNTWDGKLNKPENIEVIAKLDPKRPAIIQSHFQLVKSNDVLKKDKHAAISDSAVPEVKAMLEKIASSRAIVFVGHKNSAEKALIGGTVVQINCPQLTQYPNGYLLFDANAEGIRFSYKPSSCVYVEEFSRRLAPVYTREKNARKAWNIFVAWPKN